MSVSISIAMTSLAGECNDDDDPRRGKQAKHHNRSNVEPQLPKSHHSSARQVSGRRPLVYWQVAPGGGQRLVGRAGIHGILWLCGGMCRWRDWDLDRTWVLTNPVGD